MTQQADQFRQEFIAFAIKKEVLRFGEFKTKAGRLSPYFFNAGLFNDGESLMKLGEFYAEAIKNSGIEFDMLFGPAYKGITLAASIAIAFAKNGDVALLPTLCDGLQDHVPDLKLVPLPQATHWVVHEQPERVISEIADFLKTAQ